MESYSKPFTFPDRADQKKSHGKGIIEQGQFCLKCGCWKGQLGQEPTPELYIKHIVDIFREVKRVLRSDGTVFLNIGDSYNAGVSGYGEWTGDRALQGDGEQKKKGMSRIGMKHPIIKPQDKCLIPFRLAIALQEDGWWVRQDVIWNKPNPMPESVRSPAWVKHKIKIRGQLKGTSRPQVDGKDDGRGRNPDASRLPDGNAQYVDCPGCPKCLPNEGLILRHGSWRPTEAHEFVLMLAKSADYFCDGESLREPHQESTRTRIEYGLHNDPDGQWAILPQDTERLGERFAPPSGRNLRSVWTFSTQAYSGPHYSVFPEKLPEICIKAGTSEYGVCAECGKPYARIIQNKPMVIRRSHHAEESGIRIMSSGTMEEPNEVTTLGWKACCSCKTDKPPVPSVVLDPFAGTGTTLYVAGKLGRRSVGYEVSEDYLKLALERLKQQVLV